MPALAETLPDPVAAGWQGRSVCEVLREDVDVRIFRCVFPPGVGHERHFHPTTFWLCAYLAERCALPVARALGR